MQSNRSFHGSVSSGPPHPHPAVRKLQQASDLAYRVEALVDEVVDDCHIGDRIKTLVSCVSLVMKVLVGH